MYSCFLTCPRGLERIAQEELFSFANCESTVDKGGISFNADKETLYRTNLYSRVGMHVLVEQLTFSAYSNDELYDSIYNFHWDELISSQQTFSIRVIGHSEIFNNSQFLTLKIKDAIVDRMRDKTATRASVDKENPDISITVYIKNDTFKVYQNSSGSPLFKRGYRTKIHRAALNESLAAGLIYLTKWNKKDPFYDLMCGSGTIPIEAALMAQNIPPGIFRDKFAFENWNDFDSTLFKKIKDIGKKEIRLDKSISIYGYDISFQNITLAISSTKSIDLTNKIKFRKQDIKKFSSSEENGTILLNPPYGKRLGYPDEDLKKLYNMIGDIFKKKCVGFDAFVFTANLQMAKYIGLRAKERIILKNGNLDCRLLYYPIAKGKYT